MKNTKEEILKKQGEPIRTSSECVGLWHTESVYNAMDEYTSHLTDQIKSMEGQVKELRDENEIQGNYNDMLIKELESLQKENKEMKGALRFLCSKEHIEQDAYTAHIERYIKHFNL